MSNESKSTTDNSVVERPAPIVVKIAGKGFRCHCGCNVFHHPKKRPEVYECNACNEWYEGS